jgi:hypothetical protein
MEHAKLYQAAIDRISPPELPGAPRPAEYVHLVPFDENGRRGSAALCGFPPGAGHVSGYAGLWDDEYPITASSSPALTATERASRPDAQQQGDL